MKYTLITPLILAACISAGTLQAADVPKKLERQTTWGLYVDSQEVAKMKKDLGDKMLFIDVRDPIEIMFTGFSDVVDINIPYKIADTTAWNQKKPVFNMAINKNFEQDLEAALKARGLTKEAPIAIMCRSGGTRGAPATKLLENKGYKNVYVVTDGFEGGKVKKGEKKNWRLKNGWKNAGLPWSYKLNKDKMYMPSSTKITPEMAKKAAFISKLNHANPMPNYMPVAMKNAEALKLNEEQITKLKSWTSANKGKSKAAVMRIIELENEIATASMKGEGKETLMNKFSEMSEMRMKLAASKTACRDNMRTILTTEQWDTLVGLQAATKKKVVEKHASL